MAVVVTSLGTATGSGTSLATSSLSGTSGAQCLVFVLNGNNVTVAGAPSIAGLDSTWTQLADVPFSDSPGTSTRRLTAYKGTIGDLTPPGNLSHPAAGAWTIRQVESTTQMTQVTSSVLDGLQDTPGCVGFGPRTPWNVIETSQGVYSSTLLNQAYNVAVNEGKLFAPRFIAGQYTPAYVKTAGGTVTVGGQTIPRPFLSAGGAANTSFETAYDNFLDWLVNTWRVGKEANVPAIHCAWYSYQYSELYYGPEVQNLFSGNATTNKQNYTDAHKRLVTLAFDYSTPSMMVAFGLSGHGPINGVTDQLSTHMRTLSGSDFSPRIAFNANGWGFAPNYGEWGGALEGTHDQDCFPKAVLRGVQDIHPANGGPRSAANWDTMFNGAENLTARGATWTETYSDQWDNFQVDAASLARMKLRMLQFTESHQGGTTPGTDTLTVTFGTSQQMAQVAVLQVTGADLDDIAAELVQTHLDTATTTANITISPTGGATHVVGAFGKSSTGAATWTAGTELTDTTFSSPASGLTTGWGADTIDPAISWTGSGKWGAVALDLGDEIVVPPTQPHRLNVPYIPLGTQMDNGAGTTAAQMNALSTAQLTVMCSYYKHFHDEGASTLTMGTNTLQGGNTLAGRLVDLGAKVSKYKNSYCQQESTFGNDAQLAEQHANARDIILWFWPGNWGGPRDDTTNVNRRHKITQPLGASETELDVWTRDENAFNNASTNPSNLSIPSSNPTYVANQWPYWASKGTGTTSPTTSGAKSFIRIDNEVMRVTAAVLGPAQNGVTLTVVRGVLGTTAASHADEARVFVPVYVGAETNNNSPDATLAGNPALNGSQIVRYCVDFLDDDGADFLADRAEAAYGYNQTPRWQGYNALWWDVSGVFMYNLGDAWQNVISPWNDNAGAKHTVTTWGAAQVNKFGRFAERNWVDKNDEPIDIYANGMATNRALWVTAGIPTVTDAGIFEKHPEALNASGGVDGASSTFVTDLFDVFVNNREAILWARPERTPAWNSRVTGMRYVYCMVLQAYRSGQPTWQLCSKFDLDPGLVNGNLARKPDYIFFWNLGTPIGAPTALSQNLVSGTLYAREFTNAIVLFNPGTSSQTYGLPPNTLYDTTNATETVDPTLITASSISVPARDGKILLRSIATETDQTILGVADQAAAAHGTGTLSGASSITGVGDQAPAAHGFGSLTNTPNLDIAGVGHEVVALHGTGALTEVEIPDPGDGDGDGDGGGEGGGEARRRGPRRPPWVGIRYGHQIRR